MTCGGRTHGDNTAAPQGDIPYVEALQGPARSRQHSSKPTRSLQRLPAPRCYLPPLTKPAPRWACPTACKAWVQFPKHAVTPLACMAPSLWYARLLGRARQSPLPRWGALGKQTRQRATAWQQEQKRRRRQWSRRLRWLSRHSSSGGSSPMGVRFTGSRAAGKCRLDGWGWGLGLC